MEAKGNGKNIIYLHCHDTGRYIQPYGYAVPTPFLLSLAEEGMLFRNLHCAAPTCSPSRAALLTGMYPHNAGMFGLVNRGVELEHKECHLANYLKQYGYTTLLAGIQHVTMERNGIGYDRALDMEGFDSEQLVEHALAAVDEIEDGPFFLDLGLSDTHRPFTPDLEHVCADYVRPPELIPDNRKTRQDMADFIAEAIRFDKAVGACIKGLEERGLKDTSIILCTTDHGIAFPEMKCNLTQFGTGVFGMLICPGEIPAGMVTDALASQIDLFPTLCDLAGIPVPSWVQGKSLCPLFSDPDGEIRGELFAESNYHCNYEPQRMVRTQEWLYIKRYTDWSGKYSANCDEGLTKELFLEKGWQKRKVAKEQLYDLTFDPMERSNVADEPEYAHVLEQMRSKLEEWQEETEDPICQGRITVYCTNTPDGEVFVSDETDRETFALWKTRKQPKGYA